eukprot:Nk52_evm29s304 gene=Nk52_evmTU29s304
MKPTRDGVEASLKGCEKDFHLGSDFGIGTHFFIEPAAVLQLKGNRGYGEDPREEKEDREEDGMHYFSSFPVFFSGFAFAGLPGTRSGLHFDSTDNILYLGTGRKLVLMIHPCMLDSLNLNPIEKDLLKRPYGKSPLVDIDLNNGCEEENDENVLGHLYRHTLFQNIDLNETAHSKTLCGGYQAIYFQILTPGNVLLIPKGWIHCVFNLKMPKHEHIVAENLPVKGLSFQYRVVSITIQLTC